MQAKADYIRSIHEIVADLLYESDGFVFTTEVSYSGVVFTGIDVVHSSEFPEMRPKIFVRSNSVRCRFEKLPQEALRRILVTMACLYVNVYKGTRPTQNY